MKINIKSSQYITYGYIQVVYEERYVGKYNIPPLQAVGWEGIFGFLTLGVILIPVNQFENYYKII